jgi:hypothetical protein
MKKIVDGSLVIRRDSGAGTTGTGQRAAGGGQASILAVVSQLFDDKIKVLYWKIGKYYHIPQQTRRGRLWSASMWPATLQLTVRW